MSETGPAYDLIVVGAGGMTTALCAAHLGLKVLLCEASDQVGDTTVFSAGTFWIPGNHPSRLAGMLDTVDEARRYLNAVVGPQDLRGLREALFEIGAAAMEFLHRHTLMRFVPAGLHPDYLQREGAATSGRAVVPVPYDGRLLGDAFRRIRQPLPDFTVLGGMMLGKADVQAVIGRYRSWANFLHVGKLVGRHAMDRLRYPRGTRLVMGNALVARFLDSLQNVEVAIGYRHKLLRLKCEAGRVVGADVETEQGAKTFRSRLGVVLACGGIGQHAGLRESPAPSTPRWDSLVHSGNQGAGLDCALAVGAHPHEHPGGFFWQPVSRVPSVQGEYRLFPHLYLDRAKPGLIAVNRLGQRFTNEADSYHHFAEALWHQPVADGDAAPAFLLCDAGFVRRYGIGVVPPGTRRLDRYVSSGYLLQADTLEALALRIDVDARALQATVEMYTAMAAAGQDTAWGKGNSELNRFNGDTSHTPNPCLAAVGPGPFFAVPIWPADAGSSTGLATDADGRVLDSADRVIEGLFAVGNDMASPMQGTYPGPGITLGPAVTFGCRTACFAASLCTP